MLNLKNITLICVATKDVKASYKALKYSSKDINFEKIMFLSNEEDPKDKDIIHIKIKPFKSVADWGKFIVFDLHKYIDTDFIILIHSDGFIVNPKSWKDNFLEYDFIGAPFPIPKNNKTYSDYKGNIIRVGNSVSLRSKKILQLPSELKLSWTKYDPNYLHEDGYLSVHIRHILEKHGVNFAPFKIACEFARESTFDENRNINPFAFHKWAGPNRQYPRFSYNDFAIIRYSRKISKFFYNLIYKFGK